jgi:hypothetical protein
MAIAGCGAGCEEERSDGLTTRLFVWAVRLAGRLVGMLLFPLFLLVVGAQGNEATSLELL